MKAFLSYNSFVLFEDKEDRFYVTVLRNTRRIQDRPEDKDALL